MSLHSKYKITLTAEQLEYLEVAIERFCEKYPEGMISDDLQLYRLVDLHTIYFKVVKPKLNSLCSAGRK